MLKKEKYFEEVVKSYKKNLFISKSLAKVVLYSVKMTLEKFS